MNRLFAFWLMSAVAILSPAAELEWYRIGKVVSYEKMTGTDPVVDVAVDMFCSDMQAVTGQQPQKASHATIQLVQLDAAKTSLKKKLRKMGIPVDSLSQMDAFWLGVKKGKIWAIGQNGRGTAYALLELSRKAGVSPWIWWGDQVPMHRDRLILDEDFSTLQIPSVERRGIFINDEDWSTSVWSSQTFEPGKVSEEAFSEKRRIGPQTYKTIFQLLLRLRGNMIWPAMHEVSVPFYHVPGAKEMADSCGIIVGTSHCEPMMRNSATEWKPLNIGEYNYLTNGEAVRNYWQERVKLVGQSENVYTIGMRGLHDGNMIGPKTLDEHTQWLQRVIDDQREMLRRYVNPDLTKIPQAFVPYKEVLSIYENGLKVPDDVMLIWCDDNYGYMTRLSDEAQQQRSGGAGVYYHLSYWGRPHDYLWLTTTQPGLIYEEMSEAYRHHARKQWIVNVHDPKVASYQLELFLDMAWNYNAFRPDGLNDHLLHWLQREFGNKAGQELLPVMQEFYRLTAIRKPEFMGWNQTELDKKKYARGISPVQDTEFSFTEMGNEADRYLQQYQQLMKRVEEIGRLLRPEQQNAYMSHIRYRVFGAGLMAVKWLEAQRARQGEKTLPLTHPCREGSECQKQVGNAINRSMAAYQQIQELTAEYNAMKDGKWNRLMSSNPRDLPVFHAPTLPDTLVCDTTPRPIGRDKEEDLPFALNAHQYNTSSFTVHPVQMLGHSLNAVPLPKGEWLSYQMAVQETGDNMLYVALIPTQPNDKGDLRFGVSIDGGEEQVFSLKEPYRSERWKLNVLRGQAVRKIPLQLTKGEHQVKVRALDNHIIVDQLMLDSKPDRKFYVFPVK